MRKRMLSGIRDLWIVLFCLMERTLLQILLAVPVPVRMVLVGVLAAKYVECLVCTSLSMTSYTLRQIYFSQNHFPKDKQRRKARKNSCTNEWLQEECLTSCVGTFIIKYRIKVRESERRKQHGIREV